MNVQLKKYVHLELLGKNSVCPLKSSFFVLFFSDEPCAGDVAGELPVTAVTKVNAVELVRGREDTYSPEIKCKYVFLNGIVDAGIGWC